MALGSSQIQPRLENPRNLLGGRIRKGTIRRLFEDTKVVAGETGALQYRARVFDTNPRLPRRRHAGYRHRLTQLQYRLHLR